MPNKNTPNPTPTPTDQTTPPVPETPVTPPAQEPQPDAHDRLMNGLLEELGMKEKTGPPETPVEIESQSFVSLGERVRFDAENAKVKEEEEKRKKEKEGQPSTPATPTPPAPVSGATTPTPEPAAPAPEPPVKVIKQKPFEDIAREVAERTITERMAQQPAPAPAQPAATPAPSTPARDPIEDTLGDTEREQLEAARYGAEKYPDKYKELPGKLIKFYKEFDAYLAKQKEKDAEFDGSGPEVQQWIDEHQPTFTRGEVRKLSREQVLAEADQRHEQKLKSHQQETEQRLHRIETAPRVEKAANDFSRALHDVLATVEEGKPSVAADIAKKAKTDGWDKLLEHDQVLAPLVHRAQTVSTRRAKEYLNLTNGLTAFDASNPDHQWNLEFVRRQAQHFRQTGGDRINRVGEDGVSRTFLTPGEFNKLAQANPEQAYGRHWTWEPADILGMMAENARMDADSQVNQMLSRMEKSGYKRQNGVVQSASVPQSSPSPSDNASPKSRVSQAPGPATTTPAPVTNGIFSTEEMKRMGLPVPA